MNVAVLVAARNQKTSPVPLNLLPCSRVLSPEEGASWRIARVLGFLGFIFGGVTAVVMLVAVTVVIGHVDGRLVLDVSPPTYVAASQ